MAEESFRLGSGEGEKLIEELTKYSEIRDAIFKEIIEAVRNICKEYGVNDIYLVGGYPRDLVLGSSPVDLDFSGAWPNQCVKVGGLTAERLGVGDTDFYHRTMTLSFEYKGVKVDFRGNYTPLEIRKNLREKGIKTTPLNIDIYNRDFTINMFIYE
jgi:tRNA nucleotidyltransferase/poly(A) polymerase